MKLSETLAVFSFGFPGFFVIAFAVFPSADFPDFLEGNLATVKDILKALLKDFYPSRKYRYFNIFQPKLILLSCVKLILLFRYINHGKLNIPAFPER